jgi:hypothetical protein
MRWSILLALFGAAACSGTDTGDDDKPGDDGDDDDDTDTTDETGDTSGTPGVQYWEPVAVGFEFDGVVLANGELSGYVAEDSAGNLVEVPPVMVVTFASADFFGASSAEEQEAQSCVALALFQPEPSSATLANDDGVLLYRSYDTALDLETDPEFTDCDEKLDPTVWGENAATMLDAFDGAHFGYGWGEMTDYLLESWGTATLDDEEIANAMIASYIAINDLNGDWIASDWTTGLLFEWDPATGELVTVESPDDPAVELLVPIDVTGVPVGAPLPEGYVRSFAWWYQDFVLLDLENFKDGAP